MIDHLDHLVLTVADIPKSVAFYTELLGMRHVEQSGRHALHFGQQKINLHQVGHEFEPKAQQPTPGSADLCFIVTLGVDEIIAKLTANHVPIVEGPVDRTGAVDKICSVYIRDPDQNLIELSNRL